jgi:hypothetical protein
VERRLAPARTRYRVTADLARLIALISDPAAPGEAVWSVVELWDFGVPADITPPRPDELVPPAEACRVDPA